VAGLEDQRERRHEGVVAVEHRRRISAFAGPVRDQRGGADIGPAGGRGPDVAQFRAAALANPGYDSHNVLTVRVALSDQQYATPEKQTAFFERVVREAQSLPGVMSVSAVDDLPASDNMHGSALRFPDRPDPRPEDLKMVLRNSVMSGYFATMRIPLVRGRYLNETDTAEFAARGGDRRVDGESKTGPART
jgi:hypothetical protein